MQVHNLSDGAYSQVCYNAYFHYTVWTEKYKEKYSPFQNTGLFLV
jgi:hypothetical protein